jgi:hypothetical protein
MADFRAGVAGAVGSGRTAQEMAWIEANFTSGREAGPVSLRKQLFQARGAV